MSLPTKDSSKGKGGKKDNRTSGAGSKFIAKPGKAMGAGGFSKKQHKAGGTRGS